MSAASRQRIGHFRIPSDRKIRLSVSGRPHRPRPSPPGVSLGRRALGPVTGDLDTALPRGAGSTRIPNSPSGCCGCPLHGQDLEPARRLHRDQRQRQHQAIGREVPQHPDLSDFHTKPADAGPGDGDLYIIRSAAGQEQLENRFAEAAHHEVRHPRLCRQSVRKRYATRLDENPRETGTAYASVECLGAHARVELGPDGQDRTRANCATERPRPDRRRQRGNRTIFAPLVRGSAASGPIPAPWIGGRIGCVCESLSGSCSCGSGRRRVGIATGSGSNAPAQATAPSPSQVRSRTPTP
jgi:hypothetical protein